MTTRIEARGGKLVIDIRTRGPDGAHIRERRNAPDGVTSRSGVVRWAEARQAWLANNGRPPEPTDPAPTLQDFGARWLSDHCRAEGLKPSTIDTYERILRLHLSPVLGPVRLDAIREIEIQRVKLRVAGKADKTRACVLSVLAEMLKAAERWEVLTRAPHIDLPGYMTPKMAFYDFGEWERLVEGARRVGPMQYAMILLAGEAGLRRGEMVALEQADIGPRLVEVRRNEWKGKVGKPKGGKERTVPMTTRLREAVAAVRHLRGRRLLWQENGRKVSVTTLQSWMETACRRAGLPPSRNLHRLRHTFCSHLAMRGATTKAIQELAGHADIKTTQRYMHLSPGSKDAAIALLEAPRIGAGGEQLPAKGGV